MENVRKIVAGSYPSHAFAIDNNDTLWGFGSNIYGKIDSDGTQEFHTEPVRIMDNVMAAAAGARHSVILDIEGVVWTWGNNWSGQLGDGTDTHSLSPVRVMDNVIDVAAGESHSAALDAYGTVWTWGVNQRGQLGNGTIESRLNRGQLPIAVKSDIRAISIASNSTYVIDNDNVLWGWGMNTAGQLGDGTYENQPSPIQILVDVASVHAGLAGIGIAISFDGGLWTFGNNNTGQMGIGIAESEWNRGVYPQRILDNMVYAAGGGGYVLALDTYGNLWSWGRNDFGQLGEGSRDNRYYPQRVIYWE